MKGFRAFFYLKFILDAYYNLFFFRLQYIHKLQKRAKEFRYDLNNFLAQQWQEGEKI